MSFPNRKWISNNFLSANQMNKFRPPKDWASAPEFVPQKFRNATGNTTSDDSAPRSYANVVGGSQTFFQPKQCSGAENAGKSSEQTELCYFAIAGECRFGVKCQMIHGLQCDYCMKWCLHPYNAVQRDAHLKECIEQHQKDMEHSFAVARSVNKSCGICMEVIVEKTPVGEQRFGILPSCNHCFCLSCIRRWRQSSQFENEIVRACPECRVASDFVCPSKFWMESKEDKDKLIENYKTALSDKACRYYRSGEGTCPFGNKCFYQHALPNGTKVDVGPPPRQQRLEGANGDISSRDALTLWTFLESWELDWMVGLNDSDSDEHELFSDTDDSDSEDRDIGVVLVETRSFARPNLFIRELRLHNENEAHNESSLREGEEDNEVIPQSDSLNGGVLAEGSEGSDQNSHPEGPEEPASLE